MKRKVTMTGILIIGPPTILFTLFMAIHPWFEPDASFWFLLCATLALMWNWLVFMLLMGPRIYAYIRGGNINRKIAHARGNLRNATFTGNAIATSDSAASSVSSTGSSGGSDISMPSG